MNLKYASSIDAAIANELNTLPNVEIRAFKPAGNGLARVIVDITHTSASRDNPELVSKSLTQKLEGKLSAVSGTFTTVEKTRVNERIAGVVGVNRQIVAASSDMKGFRSSSANMFMDEEKNMWVMRKTEAGNILIKTTGVDDDTSLLKLLESCSSTQTSQARDFYSHSSAEPNVTGGDFVSFVANDNTVCAGFVAAVVSGTDDLIIVPVGGESGEVVKKGAVTDIHAQNEFPADQDTAEGQVDAVVAASRGGSSLDTIVAYYKRVYNRNPAFFKEFEKRIRGHHYM